MDRLAEIFQKQSELAQAFHHIERANGVWGGEGLVVHLTELPGQERMRSLAWRIVEELAEAMDERGPLDKASEELVDVAHYLVELMLCAGLGAADIKLRLPPLEEVDTLDAAFALAGYGPHNNIDLQICHFVTDLGMALHHLKFKPHKVNPKPTNVSAFKEALISAFIGYIAVLVGAHVTAEQLYEGYLKKNQVNHDRIAEAL